MNVGLQTRAEFRNQTRGRSYNELPDSDYPPPHKVES